VPLFCSVEVQSGGPFNGDDNIFTWRDEVFVAPGSSLNLISDGYSLVTKIVP